MLWWPISYDVSLVPRSLEAYNSMIYHFLIILGIFRPWNAYKVCIWTWMAGLRAPCAPVRVLFSHQSISVTLYFVSSSFAVDLLAWHNLISTWSRLRLPPLIYHFVVFTEPANDQIAVVSEELDMNTHFLPLHSGSSWCHKAVVEFPGYDVSLPLKLYNSKIICN